MELEKLREYTENIEQLAADLRYELNQEKVNTDKIIVLLNSIEYWNKKATNKMKKEIKKEEV